DQAREEALKLSRQITRTAATTIKHAHRGEIAQATALLDEMARLVCSLNEHLQMTPPLWFAGFVTDALKEYAEAHQTLCILQGTPLPRPQDIGITPVVYLNALGETIGEMRRHVLDLIRTGDPHRAATILEEMDEIYSLLMGFDYPDAVSLGLRRRTDAARGFVERTRGDVTTALQQARLEQKMAEFRETMGTDKTD
ncbi:MAG: haloacid dehalogenase, partial [Candidatus Zipacnadales bacterium]